MQPDNLDAYLTLAYIHRVQRQPGAAEQDLKSALQIRPNSGSAWTILGDSYLDDRKPDQAVIAYRKGVQSTPENQVAWRNLSIALSEAKRYKEAVVAGENAERMDPGDLKVHHALCYAYAMNNQPALSERAARLILQVRPEDLIAHENLGDALVKLGKKAEARAEWQFVMQHNAPAEVSKEAQTNLAKYP